jgi:hypothetical protein
MTTTPLIVERLQHALGGHLHRERDPDRERLWVEHEHELRREHDGAADIPVPGLRGMQPIDYGTRRHH